MNDEQKFEAFKQQAVAHNEKAYGAEIRAKYGEQEVDEANAAVMNLTREQYQEWTELGREIQERLEAAVQAGLSPKDEEGKKSPPSTAVGLPSPGTGMPRRSTGGSRSSM